MPSPTPAPRAQARGLLAPLLALTALLLAATSARAQSIELYDADRGSLPEAQGWIYLAQPLGQARAATRWVEGAAELDSLVSAGDQAGWFRGLEPEPGLDRETGFELRFGLGLEAEHHGGSDKDGDGREDRAGLSVIVLTRDLLGIELGFWPDRVWAQEGGAEKPPRFTQAEGSPIRMEAEPRGFRLSIQGGRYALRLEGVDEPLLRGPLRDYSPEGLPYTSPGLVFVGDDTRSAAARFRWSHMRLLPLAAEPGPSPSAARPETEPPPATATPEAPSPGPSREASPRTPTYLPVLLRPAPDPPGGPIPFLQALLARLRR